MFDILGNTLIHFVSEICVKKQALGAGRQILLLPDRARVAVFPVSSLIAEQLLLEASYLLYRH